MATYVKHVIIMTVIFNCFSIGVGRYTPRMIPSSRLEKQEENSYSTDPHTFLGEIIAESSNASLYNIQESDIPTTPALRFSVTTDGNLTSVPDAVMISDMTDDNSKQQLNNDYKNERWPLRSLNETLHGDDGSRFTSEYGRKRLPRGARGRSGRKMANANRKPQVSSYSEKSEPPNVAKNPKQVESNVMKESTNKEITKHEVKANKETTKTDKNAPKKSTDSGKEAPNGKPEKETNTKESTTAEKNSSNKVSTTAEKNSSNKDSTKAETDSSKKDSTKTEKESASKDSTKAEKESPGKDSTKAEKESSSKDSTKAEKESSNKDPAKAEKESASQDTTKPEKEWTNTSKTEEETTNRDTTMNENESANNDTAKSEKEKSTKNTSKAEIDGNKKTPKTEVEETGDLKTEKDKRSKDKTKGDVTELAANIFSTTQKDKQKPSAEATKEQETKVVTTMVSNGKDSLGNLTYGAKSLTGNLTKKAVAAAKWRSEEIAGIIGGGSVVAGTGIISFLKFGIPLLKKCGAAVAESASPSNVANTTLSNLARTAFLTPPETPVVVTPDETETALSNYVAHASAQVFYPIRRAMQRFRFLRYNGGLISMFCGLLMGAFLNFNRGSDNDTWGRV